MLISCVPWKEKYRGKKTTDSFVHSSLHASGILSVGLFYYYQCYFIAILLLAFFIFSMWRNFYYEFLSYSRFSISFAACLAHSDVLNVRKGNRFSSLSIIALRLKRKRKYIGCTKETMRCGRGKRNLLRNTRKGWRPGKRSLVFCVLKRSAIVYKIPKRLLFCDMQRKLEAFDN